MKHALITGITGQDGSYLAEFLLIEARLHRARPGPTHQHAEPPADRPHRPQTPRSSDRFQLHYADLGDASSLSQLMETIRPDEVYNLGAQSHVRVSFDQPIYTADVVGVGTLRLLEAVRQLDPQPAGAVLPGVQLRDVRLGPAAARRWRPRSTPGAPTPAPSFTPTGRRSITAKPTGCSPAPGSSSTTRAPVAARAS